MKTGKIGDIHVPLMVVLGERTLSVSDLAAVQPGSILELDSLAGEPVRLLASGETVAKGEVVVIDESFGIRITELVPAEAKP
ncbi:MAG: FliM/FliN family flagellar motor switch protein [Spirochaetales bacterium]|jgi:flagellar motor switch protein FliN/FliY|nr:FliM/FliN family flagellar motor switch protein [Spirochaetales bacterium]